jgi:predicted permease
MHYLRYGLRQLRQSPGYAVVAILTLALGIGANTAIFSMIEGVVLAPLNFADPDRLVMAWESNSLAPRVSVSAPDFRDWQRSARSFEQIVALRTQAYDLTNPGTPEHLSGQQISSGFFSTLGVELTLGRDFSPEEDVRGGAPAVIISDRLWRNRFSGSRDALGKLVTLDGVDYAVAGVLPFGFNLAGVADVYTPFAQADPLIIDDRSIHSLLCIARLKPGVTLAQARAEMSALQSQLNQTYAGADRGLGTDVSPLKEQIVGDTGGTLLLLMSAVGLVLLIACANVANLLLARSAARTREFALRMALGANRAEIVRQLITESVLLALGGGCVGLAVASWGVKFALAIVPGSLPRHENIGVNLPVLVFTFGLAVAVGIVFGLVPAWKSSNTDLQTSLKEGARGSTSGRHRAQDALVIIQIALTLVVLAGASLLFRTIQNLWDVNPGFNTRDILTFKLGLSPAATKTGATTRIAYQQLTERIRQIPGVQAADLTTLVPLAPRDNAGPFWIGSQPPGSMAEAPRAVFYETGPDYLRVTGIPLLQGRFLSAQDTTASEPVVVIDSVLAHAYFPGRDPIGQTLTVAHWHTAKVIGVVGHVMHYGLGERRWYTQNQIYFSFYQLPDDWVPFFRGTLSMVVRTPLASAAVIPAIKSAVYGVGSGQPVYDIQTMQEIVSTSMMSQRFPTILLGAFAVLALLLASIGIYSVISYLMTQRVREIGIRLALGAEKRDVLSMVLGHGLRMALAGTAIGVAASLVLARLLSSFSQLLFGVRSNDPVTLVMVSLVLMGAALLACYIPAGRAARVDPMVALRYD